LKPIVQGYVRQTTEKLQKNNNERIKKRKEEMKKDDIEYEQKIKEMKDRVYDRELLMNQDYGKSLKENSQKTNSRASTEKKWK